MAAPSAAVAPGLGGDAQPPAMTPQKIRELIDGGIAPEEPGAEGKDTTAWSESANGPSQPDTLPFETTSREAYFSRVETFTPLKWAGKPHELSPLICAKYGWTNVECDMLKCSSCQAFLCASLQLAFDFDKYKERCAELKRALCSAHEKFCFWPISPCPDRFAVLLVDEPIALLGDFLDRFQSLCQLELQLPSLRPEDLKNMSLTEEKISLLLHLIEEELERKSPGEKTPVKLGSDFLQVHVPACVLALCGWTCSPAPGTMHLPVITCCRCMRKVGLWGFHQLESVAAEADPAPGLGSTPTTPTEGRPDRLPLVPTSPHRMVTRSRDTTFSPGPEQHEKSPSPIMSRARSWDSLSPMDRADLEAASPTLRNRPVTRSMGQGDSVEVPSSPHRRAKRARLCSSSSSDTSTKSFFDPSSQHRDWCPWVNVVEKATLEDSSDPSEHTPTKAEPGWRAMLSVLLATQKSERPTDTEPVSLSVKSCKVFRIFRRWEAMCS
ncbi:PREDICTED: nuclear-interacting partner of ALK [Gavialis gangeticus]|uniref:nuclear-interacting partner of ALK n=1 Tax=Gavialis gangeticus TaxID=94835 RepID=UPI00092ED1A5|nr:PREDICTED: nuclear-interacting partner of ALK [Gavialis gangeticus]